MQKFVLGIFAFLFLEILILIQVGYVIGAFNTVIIMFAMMVVGVVIIKTRFKQAMTLLQQGQVDVRVIFLPLAGFLFLFPGFISDIIAILLVVPQFQNRCVNLYKKNSGTGTSFAFRNGATGGFSDVFSNSGNVIDSTATNVTDDSSQENESSVNSDSAQEKTSTKIEHTVIEDAQVIDESESQSNDKKN